jgi:hypothetical protein
MAKQYLFKRESKRSFQDQEEIDIARRALRLLRDSFHMEPEVELEKLLLERAVQKRVGVIVAQGARPRKPFLRLV